MNKCNLCPRKCNAEREESSGRGICAQGSEISVSRASLHMWEEPPISGERGSGTIFFTGCSLHCVFCQNSAISRVGCRGKVMSPQELCEVMLGLQSQGAENINLVTPTHFAVKIAEALTEAKKHLTIPVVYNSSGYESVDTLRILDGLVDVYMPDFKYFSSEISAKYAACPDYSAVALAAIGEMFRQSRSTVFDGRGIMRRGLLIRHLILPSCRHDSMEILRTLSQNFPLSDIRLSLMSQYTPDFAKASPYPELHRRITSFEYASVLEYAQELGFIGYMQQRASATPDFTPDF